MTQDERVFKTNMDRARALAELLAQTPGGVSQFHRGYDKRFRAKMRVSVSGLDIWLDPTEVPRFSCLSDSRISTHVDMPSAIEWVDRATIEIKAMSEALNLVSRAGVDRWVCQEAWYPRPWCVRAGEEIASSYRYGPGDVIVSSDGSCWSVSDDDDRWVDEITEARAIQIIAQMRICTDDLYMGRKRSMISHLDVIPDEEDAIDGQIAHNSVSTVAQRRNGEWVQLTRDEVNNLFARVLVEEPQSLRTFLAWATS